MKHKMSATLLFVLLGAASTVMNAQYDSKESLIRLMNDYFEALVKHDPTGLPLAANVKLVENTEVTPIGKGLWATATKGPSEFSIVVADAVAGQVGFIGVIEEDNKPTIASVRLRVAGGMITEIDHLIIHSDGRPLHPNMSAVRPAILEPVNPGDRVPRDEMMRIANLYYEAIIQDNGEVAPFADECQRRENGGISANDQTQTPEEAKNDDFSVFRKMTCCDQLTTGVMSYITDINRRRILAVDEELGLVFAYSMFVHDGEPRVMKITGVPGVTERANNYGPFDLPAAHIFKIKGGKIYDIEAIGYIAPHGIKNGWE